MLSRWGNIYGRKNYQENQEAFIKYNKYFLLILLNVY